MEKSKRRNGGSIILNNYELITKETGLTKQEYKQLYNSLVYDDTYIIPRKKEVMNEIIKKLKYRNKSALNLIRKWFICPQKFKYKRILQAPEYKKKNKASIFGKNSHLIFNKVWDIITIDELIEYYKKNVIATELKKKCYNLEFIPEQEKKFAFYQLIINNYCDYEEYRIQWLFKQYKYEQVLDCLIPIFREAPIENFSYCRKGIIDCVHKFPNNTYRIVDYKSGSPKYALHNKFNKEDIFFEIGEYYKLLIGDAHEIYEKDKVLRSKELPFLNITHGTVIYLQDWKNTFIYFPINDELLQHSNNANLTYIEMINNGNFERCITSYCMFCEYFYLCIKNKKWKEMENYIDKDILAVFK